MECSICFEAVTKQTGSVVLSCDHPFHFRCIENWFSKQVYDGLDQTCPCCRSKGTDLDRCEVVEMDEEDDDETYEEVEEEEDSESLNDLAREIQQGLFRLERLPSGDWVIQNNEEVALDSFRALFYPLNQLDEVDEAPVAHRFSLYHWTVQDGTITRPASNREVRFLENQTTPRPPTSDTPVVVMERHYDNTVQQMVGRVSVLPATSREHFVHTIREPTREEAARKIQAFFRGNQARNTHEAAMTLLRLFQQAYNV